METVLVIGIAVVTTLSLAAIWIYIFVHPYLCRVQWVHMFSVNFVPFYRHKKSTVGARKQILHLHAAIAASYASWAAAIGPILRISEGEIIGVLKGRANVKFVESALVYNAVRYHGKIMTDWSTCAVRLQPDTPKGRLDFISVIYHELTHILLMRLGVIDERNTKHTHPVWRVVDAHATYRDAVEEVFGVH